MRVREREREVGGQIRGGELRNMTTETRLLTSHCKERDIAACKRPARSAHFSIGATLQVL